MIPPDPWCPKCETFAMTLQDVCTTCTRLKNEAIRKGEKMGNVPPYLTRKDCEKCGGKNRLHLKGQCVICADMENKLDEIRRAEGLGNPEE